MISFRCFYFFIAVTVCCQARAQNPEVKPLDIELLANHQRILILGDSITYAGDYVSYFATWAQIEHGIPFNRFLNVGLPSETISGLSEEGHADGRFPRPYLHERLGRVLKKVQPDLIIACYGMNCGIYKPFDEDRFRSYQAGYEKLKVAADAHSIDLVCVTPPIFDSLYKPDQNFYESVLHRYAEWLIEKRGEGWTVIDVHFEMQRALEAGRNLDADFSFQPDSVHPNDAGHRVMATAMIHAFEPRFNSSLFGTPEYETQFIKTKEQQKAKQRQLLESTQHRRPEVPGFIAN